MTKRFFDIVSASLALIVLFVPLAGVAIWITSTSKGGAFYLQTRVGRHGKPFRLVKFRSMRIDSDRSGQLTIGERDSRITKAGYFVRKYKIDELPQLINVIKGEMSVVGPRPEVPRYVSMYNDRQLGVLAVRPGLTDYASLRYVNENEVLGKAADPEKAYVNEVMPHKLELNLKYINEADLGTDLRIILQTLKAIFR